MSALAIGVQVSWIGSGLFPGDHDGSRPEWRHGRPAQQVDDYVGMLLGRNLIAFGKGAEMFSSWFAPCQQFLHGITGGPIGMSEERDRPELL